MDPAGVELIVIWYLELESRLLSALSTVSYSAETKSIFLPPLANIVVDTCSLIDTVFREEYYGPKNKDDATIVDYSNFYEPRFGFSGMRTLVYQYPPLYMRPFAAWNGIASEGHKKLDWWESYNRLKHNRIKHHQVATLETSLFSLTALFQAISPMKAFLASLIRHDLIYFGSWDKEYAKQAVFEEGKDVTLLAESELFATPIGTEKFPDDISAIDPHRFCRGKKLWRYVGRDS